MKPDSATLKRLLLEAVREHNVLPLTGRCNLACCFCSHRHNPPGTHAYDFPPLDPSLLNELIPALNPGAKIIVGESATRLREGEPLTHPHALNILKQLRKQFPETLLQLTTNAALLDGGVIRCLASLAPLELVVSLNSAAPRGRRLLMADPYPADSIQAVQKLSAGGIPFHGSVVALPHLVGWADLDFTLRFLDEAGAQTIRLLQPGYTRCSDASLVPPPQTRDRCDRLVEKLQQQLRAPLLVEPPRIDGLAPVIEGIIDGSPACLAGLRPGDLLRAVNGEQPDTRVAAYYMARRAADPRLELSRDGGVISATLLKQPGAAPGFAVSHDLDPVQVERVRRRLVPGKETLMLTSGIALKRWRAAVDLFQLTGLRPLPVRSLFFGGSINCAGLLTVGDCEAVLDRELSGESPSPARVLLPAVAFDSRGYDMAGRHYDTLLEYGVPVELLG